MARPNLLLCFDAFGTLFKPRFPVAHQYGQVARQCGITGFSESELQSHLAAAFKHETKENPNYGRETGLGATKWWTNVIHRTFTPLLNGRPLPADLAPKLLDRFSSCKAYDTEKNLVSTLRSVRQRGPRLAFDRVLIGVVTNSDDRVPSILSSFGLNVSPLHFGAEDGLYVSGEMYDIDFHCMSYHAGVEKPDPRIFQAAEHMLAKVLAADEAHKTNGAAPDTKSWRKMYLGDEYAKDVVGAQRAGWSPVLLDPNDKATNIPFLEECNHSIDDIFEKRLVVRVRSIQNLATWLVNGSYEA
ncbi:hypothetical protein QQS21_006928 [Conoideocrella luteorostrata]|uniref:Haloacid dehalogenase n=1 Tax=Conoideocrella luteorostrata TaxID=1105319 RepID=A0AAJ0CLN2_9HYPO|nr:hypothetical protein QQS21_006928 [Conoideocrella luteorostrata]